MGEINYVQEAKSILKTQIEPKLKGEGFRKNGNTFYRPKPGFIDICNVQFGRDNTRECVSFTYNIKIAMPSLYETFNLSHGKKLDCIVMDHGLGTIMGIFNNTFMIDYWYKIGNTYELDYEKNFVRNAIMHNEPPQRIEELRSRGKHINLLNNRYDRKNLEEAIRTINLDLDNIVIQFFNRIQNIDDLAKLIISIDVSWSFEELFFINVLRRMRESG